MGGSEHDGSTGRLGDNSRGIVVLRGMIELGIWERRSRLESDLKVEGGDERTTGDGGRRIGAGRSGHDE